jgi:hypothetical protein
MSSEGMLQDDDGNATQGTSSLTRNISHLDQMRWMQAVALSALLRTMLQHPLNVALARKRIHRRFVTLRAVLGESYAVGASAAGARRPFWAGVRSMYRGFGVCVVGNIIGECLYLAILEHVRHKFPSDSSVVRDAVGGATGDLASLVVLTPLSVVCNRQMTAGFGMASNLAYESAPAVVRRLAAGPSGALRGLYAGFVASLYVVPASAIWWGSYGVIKSAAYSSATPYLSRVPSERLPAALESLKSTSDNPLLNGFAGVTAALVTTTVTNPFMVVRTRMQVLDENAAAAQRGTTWLTRRSRIARVCNDLVLHEGYRAFFKGLRVSASVAALDGLIFSSIYEFTKWFSDRTL